MPQIFLILSPNIKSHLVKGDLQNKRIDELCNSFIPIVEKVFGIESKKDVAFTVVSAEITQDEADFQFEIRYTCGTDEYKEKEIFEPTMEQQATLSGLLNEQFQRWRLEQDCWLRSSMAWTMSVWCKPFKNSHFKMFIN